MKRFRNTLKLLVLVILIILASLGVAISGGAPVPALRRREEQNRVNTELLKTSDENESEKD